MFRRNQDIRDEIKRGRVPCWLIAEKMGFHENTLYRMLNKELTTDQKDELLSIIEELKQEIKVG